MALIRVKGGTRAQLDAAAAANQLAEREPYFISDEDRLAVGTAANGYSAMAKEGEGGSAPPVDALTVTYTNGRVTGIDEDGVDTTITYNTDGTVDTVSYPSGALTRTETYTYTSGRVTGMTAAEA